jgi:hypothetical protein
MIKRITASALLGAGALAVGAGCAGTSEAKRDVTAAVPMVEQNWKGVVLRVDTQTDRISVRTTDSGEPVQSAWFSIQSDTKVERDGKRVELREIQPGDPVRVGFEPAVGAERAYKVQILTGAEADEVLQKSQQMRGSR